MFTHAFTPADDITALEIAKMLAHFGMKIDASLAAQLESDGLARHFTKIVNEAQGDLFDPVVLDADTQ